MYFDSANPGRLSPFWTEGAMHAFKTLPPLQPIEPIGDPRSMEFGSDERRLWFQRAREYMPDFDPAAVDASELIEGSIAWHLWCEWDRRCEAMDELYNENNQFAIADQACQEPDEPGRWKPILTLVPSAPKRTRKHAMPEKTDRVALLEWVEQMG